jgi:pimeloyl-ACP methyl ester carboxylesterase
VSATSFVLVHGPWHDPRHFDEVTRQLRGAGLAVAVPELHRGSLAEDTAVVQRLVDGLNRPPVVLGHSYGGSVITGLTNVAHLVHVAAFVPTETESAAQLGGTSNLVDRIVRNSARRHDALRSGGSNALYGDCSPAAAARATALLRPQAPGHGRGFPTRAAWKTVPSTYVVCAEDRAVDHVLQYDLAQRCGATLVWPTSHSPFYSRPDLVFHVLTELVASTDSPGD